MMTDTAGTRTRDRSDDEPWVVAGVDTHKDTHHVAVGSAATGAGLGDMQVPATPAGYDQPRDFVRSHGRIRMIGIEGTGSYGAGLARAPGGRRRADPRGHPSQALPAPPRQVRPDRRLRRRRQSTGRGRRPARGQDRHRPLRTDPGAPGLAPQRDEGPRRRPPADHRPADHRPRRRAHPLRPPQRRGSSSAPWPARAPPRPPTPPHRRPRERCAAWPAATRSRADEITDIDTELRALTARAAPTMLATKALRRQPPPPCSSPPATTPTESAPRHPSPPCAAPPRSPPAPGKTNRHRLNRGGDRQANWALHQIALVRLSSDPRTKAYAARLTATGKNCKEILRCLKRAIAREAWHLLTHPQPAPRTDDLRRLRHERGLTLTQAAHHLNTHPARISELERGTRPDTTLTAAYRQWLNTQQPQTHTT